GAWFFGLLAARLSPAGGGSRHGRGDRGGRDPELLLERFDALGELEHGDALELLDPILSTGCHAALVLLGGTVLGGRRLPAGRGVRLVVLFRLLRRLGLVLRLGRLRRLRLLLRGLWWLLRVGRLRLCLGRLRRLPLLLPGLW